MLLILHQNENWVESFQKYLKESNVSSLFLTWREIINSLQISSLISKDSRSETKLYFKGKSIPKVDGIYNTLKAPSLNDLNQFIKEDQQYAQHEFFSLLMHILSEHSNVLNPVDHRSFALSISVPINILFKTVYRDFFKVPKYIFSTDIEDLISFSQEQPTCFSNHIYKPIIPNPINYLLEDSLIAVECIRGEPIIVHVIDEEAYSTIFYKDGKEIFDDPTLNDYCIKLTKEYGMVVGEVLVYRSEGNYYLYYLKSTPDWDKSSHDHEIYWHLLAKTLSSNYKEKKFFSYINASLRPEIIGQFINK